VVSVRAMYYMLVWVLMLVSVFSQVGPGLVSIANILLFRIMCVRYLISIWEDDPLVYTFWI
jgi:hypothetical protein